MPDDPLVSIIVRTKDRPKLLMRALQSIAAQTYRPIEVVLVNDGGCDLDVEEIKGILRDISLNYIRLEQNTGRAHAGNVGIENAKGEYIGFLDDDDELYPEHIETLITFLKDGADCIGAYTDSEILQREYDTEGNVIKEHNKGVFRSWDFTYEVLLFENYIPLMCSLLKREVLSNIGGFDETYEIFEDWDFFIRATSEKPLYHIAKVTTKYIQWSSAQQIAFIDWPHARAYYLKVLTKHLAKLTPEAIYKYFTVKQALYSSKEEQAIELRKLQEEIRELNKELRVRNNYIEQKQKEVEELRKEAEKLIDELRVKNSYIEDIHNSLGWRLLHFYRTRIKAIVFPLGTRREKVYKLIHKVLFTMLQSGARVAIWKINNKLKQRRARKRIKWEKFNFPMITNEAPDMIDRRISIVIPTKNAGIEFKNTLEKIQCQKGVREVEIVIVDSGSKDNTLGMASQYGAKVLCIRPEEFNHGLVRNIGAQSSTGDYIVFLSQDVIPIGETCIHDILKVMEKDKQIAAATVKQVPRSEADLFACWQLWYYHNKLLGISDDRIAFVSIYDLAKLSPTDKRRVSQINNIFSCIRKDIFDRFKFNLLPYAEDLDLGLRLIADGYKIAFFSSIGAIHSHNRNPAYYFKRSFVDVKSLIQLLDYEPIRWDDVGLVSTEDVLSHTFRFYCTVNSMVDSLKDRQLDQQTSDLIDGVKRSLFERKTGTKSVGDKSLDELLLRIVPYHCDGEISYKVNYDPFVNYYKDLIDSFGEYLGIFGDLSDKEEEFIQALYKIFAVVAGSNIGNFAVYLRNKGISEKMLDDVITVLGDGI